jgi:ankyrin repeat protein
MILHLACLCGHLDIVQSLVEKGADINAKNTNAGSTPLYLACSAERF